ncbi:MFS-type transporter SLC18B1 [Sarcoptes scabiei]|nr:MFS-type transporter SLC18B1 [Sarcoptes scabiei]
MDLDKVLRTDEEDDGDDRFEEDLNRSNLNAHYGTIQSDDNDYGDVDEEDRSNNKKSLSILDYSISSRKSNPLITSMVVKPSCRKHSRPKNLHKLIVVKQSKHYNHLNYLQFQHHHNHEQQQQQSSNRFGGNRRRFLRRSLSYDTLPKMKNKMLICQPLTLQRRLTVPAKKFYFSYKNKHLILICLAFISFTAMLAMAIIAPFFPTESAKKGMRESVNGLVFSVYAMVFMICSPIISLMIPIVGTKLTLILGIFIAGTSNILFGLLDRIDDLQTFTLFCFLVRTFEAIGGTAFSTATYTILMQEFPNNIGTAFSIVETSVGLGLSLGPAIGGFLYSIDGYELPFFILGALMLINIPLCLVIIRDSKNCATIKSPLKAYFKLLNLKMIINSGIIVIAAQLLSFLDPTVEPHLRKLGLGTHYVSLVFLVLSATYTLSSPFIGWISSSIENKFKIMSIGLMLLAVEFFFLGPSNFLHLETSFVQITIIMALIGISYSLAFIPTFENMIELSIKNGFPNDITTYSLVSGLWTAFCSLGEILGPIFGGFLTENFGFETSSSAMGCSALFMAVLCFVTCFYSTNSESYNHHPHHQKNCQQRNRYASTPVYQNGYHQSKMKLFANSKIGARSTKSKENSLIAMNKNNSKLRKSIAVAKNSQYNQDGEDEYDEKSPLFS